MTWGDRITDDSLPTNTQIFKSTYVAHYSNESPTDIEATDAPHHSSRKAEDQTVRVVIYLVYDSSWLGFFFQRLGTLLSLKQNKNGVNKLKDR